MDHPQERVKLMVHGVVCQPLVLVGLQKEERLTSLRICSYMQMSFLSFRKFLFSVHLLLPKISQIKASYKQLQFM